SAFSMAEQTFVDGRLLFSRDRDAALRTINAMERARIIQKILSDKKARPEADAEKKPDAAPPAGGPEGRPRRRPPQTLLEKMLADADSFRREQFLRYLERGIDPTSARSGVCGCD
ncbi:MAG: hypothetical protein ACT4PL_14030, partial [Phycisphaerales bacterium]